MMMMGGGDGDGDGGKYLNGGFVEDAVQAVASALVHHDTSTFFVDHIIRNDGEGQLLVMCGDMVYK